MGRDAQVVEEGAVFQEAVEVLADTRNIGAVLKVVEAENLPRGKNAAAIE